VPAGGLGLVGAGIDELNAMTVGAPLGPLVFFSVDRASAGVPVSTFDVGGQAALGQAAGDVFVAPGPPGFPNLVWINQDLLGELPAVGMGLAVPPPIDDLDAVDRIGPLPMFMALLPGHPYLGASGLFGCGGDLFVPVGGGPPGPGLPFLALGLGSCLDDVDALFFDPGPGDVYYSLAPGSPSLLPGSPIAGCAGGCSAADIFVAPGGAGAASIAIPFFTLGLLPGDNVNAIDLPEPGAAAQLVPGAALLIALARRRRAASQRRG
jgi:hypothetical protein